MLEPGRHDVAAAAHMVGVEGAILEPRQILEMTQLLERSAEIHGILLSAAELILPLRRRL